MFGKINIDLFLSVETGSNFETRNKKQEGARNEGGPGDGGTEGRKGVELPNFSKR